MLKSLIKFIEIGANSIKKLLKTCENDIFSLQNLDENLANDSEKRQVIIGMSR